jgi:hypothetical protein
MYCFPSEHVTLVSKNKDGLVRNQDNVSEWNVISTRGVLFQWASTIKIKLSVLVSNYLIHWATRALRMEYSEWLLFNAKWAIFKLYHNENKLYSMLMMSALY